MRSEAVTVERLPRTTHEFLRVTVVDATGEIDERTIFVKAEVRRAVSALAKLSFLVLDLPGPKGETDEARSRQLYKLSLAVVPLFENHRTGSYIFEISMVVLGASVAGASSALVQQFLGVVNRDLAGRLLHKLRRMEQGRSAVESHTVYERVERDEDGRERVRERLERTYQSGDYDRKFQTVDNEDT